jgi:hypothetical protein
MESQGKRTWPRLSQQWQTNDDGVNTLKRICLTIIQLAKLAWLLPQAVVNAHKQRRRRQAVRNRYEADRLDRLRNPSKYLGK